MPLKIADRTIQMSDTSPNFDGLLD